MLGRSLSQCSQSNVSFGTSSTSERRKRAKHSLECRYCDRAFGTTQAREQHEDAVHRIECDECDRAFCSSTALGLHKQDAHDGRGKHPFQCNYCNRTFGSVEAREQHEGAVHPAHHKCDDCDRAFLSPDALQQHRRDSHLSFPCFYCDRVFKSAEACSQHEAAIHLTHECDECDKAFSSANALDQHNRDKHPSFDCAYCGRTFKSAEACSQHEAAVHPVHICDECDKAFLTSDARDQHKRDKHPSFGCAHCGRMFKSAEACAQHETAVHPAHKCDECDKAFLTPDARDQHKRDKHPSFGCAHCSRMFWSAEACSQHEAAVHPTHKCDECDRAFLTPDARDQHKRDKHPSFGCAHCDCMFKSAEACSQHETAAHRTHKCDKCSKAFSTSDARDQHKRDKHPSFGCAHCDCMFWSAEACSQHETAAHPAHKCDKCSKAFFSSESLEQHKRDKHGSFECRYCSRAFNSIEARDQHVGAVHPTLPCHEYSKKFRSPSALEERQLGEHSSFKCSFCDFEFSSSVMRDGHEVAAHFYPCTQCDYDFKSADALEQHGAALHGVDLGRSDTSDQQDVDHSTERLQSPALAPRQETGLQASSGVGDFATVVVTSYPEASGTPPGLSSSGKQSSDPESGSAGEVSSLHSPASYASAIDNSDCQLEAYCTKENISEDPRSPTVECSHSFSLDNAGDEQGMCCWRCGGVFDNEEDCKAHSCGFLGTEIPLHCSDCYSCFADETSLQRHIAQRMAFTCQWCGLQFCFESLLQDHMESHFQCRRCGTSFVNESELLRHTELDHPVVVCWECGGAVILQDNLELHYASEHPTCAICGVRMKERDLLDEHVSSEHANAVYPLESDRISESEGGRSHCNHVTDSQSWSGGIHADDEERNSALPSRSLSPCSQGLSQSAARQVDQPLADSDHEKETTSDLRQVPLPSPTPPVNGSGASQSDLHTLVAEETLPHSDAQPASPNSSFLSESYDSASDHTTSTSSSQSVVYVTVDSIPEYARENCAYLVATSAPSVPSSTATSPLRLPSAISSLDSMELVPPISDASTPTTVTPSRNEIRLHCRICSRDPCENMTATICGHIFCNSCITQAIVSKPECPVCKSATLVYCLFRLDLTA
ncbi:hypothetical protein EDD15DRAFT_2537570 [Pisolithus albus]|nr:hypothetical protein EDD15DRAFT_2537570 [Pisolithus albus]